MKPVPGGQQLQPPISWRFKEPQPGIKRERRAPVTMKRRRRCPGAGKEGTDGQAQCWRWVAAPSLPPSLGKSPPTKGPQETEGSGAHDSPVTSTAFPAGSLERERVDTSLRMEDLKDKGWSVGRAGQDRAGVGGTESGPGQANPAIGCLPQVVFFLILLALSSCPPPPPLLISLPGACTFALRRSRRWEVSGSSPGLASLDRRHLHALRERGERRRREEPADRAGSGPPQLRIKGMDASG